MIDNSPGRGFAALILIGLGMLFFMGIDLLWPMFILVPGLLLLSGALAGGRIGAAALAIPAMLITGTGTLLFVQNWTGYWESWAYAWTLFGVFLGMGFMLMGQRMKDESLLRVGRGFVHAGLIAFAGFAIFFEVLIAISGHRGPVGPLMLIVLGLFLISRDGVGRQLVAALATDTPEAKAKPKAKRSEDKLFTGPIVYGTRVTSRSAPAIVTTKTEAPPLNQPDSNA